MATSTNESLDKLYKKDLILIVLSSQNKLDEANNSKTELLDEIHKLNDKFDQLQTDACIMQIVNNLLSSRRYWTSMLGKYPVLKEGILRYCKHP